MPSSREIYGWRGYPGLPSFEMRHPNDCAGRHPDIHVCIRIYANGQWKVEPRTLDEIGPTDGTATQDTGWFGYNAFYRWGNALFIDGKCVSRGYLSPEQVAWVEGRLARGEKPTDYGQIEPGMALWGRPRLAYANLRDIYTTRTLTGAWAVVEVSDEAVVLQRLAMDRMETLPGTGSRRTVRFDDPNAVSDWQRAGRYNGDLPE
jgi:hypothetical protein